MEKAKILIVDDEKAILRNLKSMLEEEGYEVETTSSAKEAIRIAEENKFDLVYVDLVINSLDGVDVCKGIKEASPHTEIVIFTGKPKEMVKKEVDFIRAGGRDEILRKPIYKKELIEITQRVLNNRRLKKNETND